MELRIAPAPIPNVWEIGVDPNQGVVALTAHTPAGVQFYFMDAEGTEKFGEQLIAAAKQAKTGLVIPSTGLVPGIVS